MTAEASFDLAPVVIGVTGHRDIPEGSEPLLRQRFGELLDRIGDRCPHSPLLILSALATGADIIAADEALDRGIRVMAVLPMDAQEYERDFLPQELERFRDVLARCWHSVALDDTGDRARAYAHAGSFIAYYSTLLVAFWDGLEAKGFGGTADVVRMRQSGPEAALDMVVPYLPDVGPIFQIVTPRGNHGHPHNAYAIVEHYPKRTGLDLISLSRKKHRRFRAIEEAARHEFEEALTNIDRFNRDLSHESTVHSHDALETFFKRIGEAAQDLQRWTLFSMRGLYVMAAIAGVGQLIIAPPLEFPAATPIRMALLALAFLWFRYAKAEDYENRYQDYRAIAEALRVQHAWCCAGLRDRLAESSYLQMQQSEMQWIRLALRTIYLAVRGASPCDSDDPRHHVCRSWVDGQVAYYANAGARQQNKQRKAEALMTALAGTGIAIALAAVAVFLLTPGITIGGVHLPALGDAYPVLKTQKAGAWVAYCMAAPAAVLGWIALLVRFYAQQRGYSENARRYHHMLEVFSTAQRLLRNEKIEARGVLERLGHEALSEHADWLILHRERPLHFVSG